MITAEQVREEMRRQEISQTQLANKAKLSQSIISKWLSGTSEPSDITKQRVARALGLQDETPEPEIPGIVGTEPSDEDAAFDAIAAALGLTPPEEPEEAPEPKIPAADNPAPDAPKELSSVEALILAALQLDGVRVWTNPFSLEFDAAIIPPTLEHLMDGRVWAQKGLADGIIDAALFHDIVAGLIRRYKED